MTPRWVSLSSAVALVGLATVQGCSDDGSVDAVFGRDSEIRVLATQSATLGIPRVRGQTPMVLGWVNVCLEGDHAQRIEEVRAVGATRVVVLDFAVRDAAGSGELDWPHGLEEAGFDRDAKTVSLRCEEPGAAHQLGIELQTTEPGATVGAVKSFEVVWAGGKAAMPLAVVLCPFETAWDDRCQDLRPG